MNYKIYAENVEQSALDQFHDAMKQDFVIQGALMPDAHTGYSLPIGAVVATRNVVVPAWVGYDIGCGMCAIPTTFFTDEVRNNAVAIKDEIYKMIPVGFKHNERASYWPEYNNIKKTGVARDIFEDIAKPGLKQLGTLGGGNHFIEIGFDDTNRVWVIIHSGSRNIGHRIATHYMKAASLLHTGKNKAKEGHYGFAIDTVNEMSYVMDAKFAEAFALQNRVTMLERIENALSAHTTSGCFDWDALINRNHNHVEWNQRLQGYIHRKGATHAEEGMYGVIPGNMRDGSFIVRGLGNPDSLFSSSHGAGRVLGRKKAKETLSVDDFKSTMKGITCNASSSTLDESPMAYKDIFEVMRLQSDLVETVAHVTPILNVKG